MAARQSRGRWHIALIILTGFLVMLSILLIPVLGFDYGINHRFDHITFSEIYRITHIEFPANSKLLNSTGISFMHTNLWLKVEIKPQDAEVFLRTLNKTHPINISRKKKLFNIMGNSPRDIKRGSFDWWNTADVRYFISAESAVRAGSGGTEIAVLIDLDHPNKAIVYLSYFND